MVVVPAEYAFRFYPYPYASVSDSTSDAFFDLIGRKS
jgi:hypothetical protein